MQRLPLCVALAGLALTSSVRFMVAVGSQASHGPVYSVAQVQAGLADQPQAWLQRTVRMHTLPVLRWCFVWKTPGPSCQLWEPALLSAGANDVEPLPLAWGSASPLVAFLRRVLPTGFVVPASQGVQWATPGVYRVQLQPTSCFSPGTAPCYEAVVLDVSA